MFTRRKALSVGVWVLYEKMRRTYGLSKMVFNLSHPDSMYFALFRPVNVNTLAHLGCDIEGVNR